MVPAADSLSQRGNQLVETFSEPVPFVCEVWSPSTGRYDIDTKLPDYLDRGDGVIWRVHPYQRTVRSWERQEDGDYLEREYTGGAVSIPSLPGVVIGLDELFA
jgi:Uma2 family endonuclease